MIRHRWLLLIAVLQVICAMIVVDTPTGSDWLVGVTLFASGFLTLSGFFRLEGWD